MGAFYKKTDIIDNYYYKPPAWINANFSDIQCTTIEIHDGDRLDIIAEQLYQDPSLWKALALLNNLNYFFDITPGMVIKIPVNIKDVLERI
jgi:hypothetical protein